MGVAGPDFYDDERVFATYMRSRDRPDNPNDTIEQPILRGLAGPLSGLRILDLGCGRAAFGCYALENGCRSYTGVDGSRRMVAVAREALHEGTAEIVQADIERWTAPAAAVDLVVSSLALHYVQSIDDLLRRAHGALVPGGRLVFSVEHPVITSCDRGWVSGQRQSWIVDDYFVEGPRETAWLGGQVVKYHRTVETYVAAVERAGFVLTGLRESAPERARFTDKTEYERRMRIPLFLFLAGQKPARAPQYADGVEAP